ncbi:c-type cytochrome [Granulicella sp. 5B5]|nr:c-type cytochrome [Granulicella sp. 5B5]
MGAVVVAGLVLVAAASTAQQEPPAKSTTAVHHAPTNLKVLPKDISSEELHARMRQYVSEVGVPCGYCHAENPQTGKLDFASDDNPVKETARFMIKMTDDINTKYLAQLGDRRYSPAFTCGSCHQGQPEPPTFVPKASTPKDSVAKP